MNSNKAHQMQINTGLSKISHRIGKPKSIMSFVGPIRRFQYFIERTDWDKDLLKCEKWMDLICWTVIATSVLFFIPVSISVVGR
jgi:hypothetical protein